MTQLIFPGLLIPHPKKRLRNRVSNRRPALTVKVSSIIVWRTAFYLSCIITLHGLGSSKYRQVGSPGVRLPVQPCVNHLTGEPWESCIIFLPVNPPRKRGIQFLSQVWKLEEIMIHVKYLEQFLGRAKCELLIITAWSLYRNWIKKRIYGWKNEVSYN